MFLDYLIGLNEIIFIFATKLYFEFELYKNRSIFQRVFKEMIK